MLSQAAENFMEKSLLSLAYVPGLPSLSLQICLRLYSGFSRSRNFAAFLCESKVLKYQTRIRHAARGTVCIDRRLYLALVFG